jgi:hypothetical protein
MADCNGAAFHVFEDNRIGANPGVRADFDRSQNLRAGTDVDMVSDHGEARNISSSDGNLLKYKTVDANAGARMDHNSIWMRNEKSPTEIGIKRNIGACHHAPKAMPNDKPFEDGASERVPFVLQALIAANSQEQFSPWIPKAPGRFSCPIWDLRARTFLQSGTFSLDLGGINGAAS